MEKIIQNCIWAALIVVLVMFLFGCQTMTANKAVEVTSDTLLTTAGYVDTAESRGWIDNETENRLINRLIDGQRLLKGTYTVGEMYGCDAAMTKQECLNLILIEVEKELAEAGQ